MNTMLLNVEVNSESDSWSEYDFKASGNVISGNATDVVLQELEINNNVIAVSEAANGTTVFGGDKFGVYWVHGASQVNVTNGNPGTNGTEVTPSQRVGVVDVGNGSANITYAGGDGQDIIALQKDVGDACIVNGGAGNDIITVVAGTEHVLTGGAGNDRYVIDNLEAECCYKIIQTEAGSKDRDTLSLTAFKSKDFTVDASDGRDIVLTYANRAKVIIVDWFDNPLMNIAFADGRVKVAEIAQSKAYTSYNLKLTGNYSFSGRNQVKAQGAILQNRGSGDVLTVSGNNNTVVVNGGQVAIEGGSENIIDNSVSNGKVSVYGGENLSVQGSEGVDYLKICGGNGIVAALGSGEDQIEVCGGSDNTLIINGGQDQKKIVLKETVGDNCNIVAEETNNEIEIKGGSGHTITCGAYADKITIDNPEGQDYIINTGDGDDYVFIKSGHVKLLEMGEGNHTVVLENGIVDSIKSQGEIITVLRGGVAYIDENTKKIPILQDGENTVYFTNVNLKEFQGGLGNDTFVLNSGYVGTLTGNKGSDTYILNHLDNNQEYVINQGLPDGGSPLNSEKDFLVLNNYDSTSFVIAKDDNGDVLLTNAELNAVIRIEGWQKNALSKIVFRDKEVSGKTINAVTGSSDGGLSQLQIMRDFMQALDETTTFGNKAFDVAVVACSRGLYSSAQDLVDRFIYDCVNHGGYNYDTQKQFLLEYCGINLNNTDTGAITGADAGGPVVKNSITVVEEPKGMTLSDLVYDYTDTIEAYDYFNHTLRTFTCAKVNCNGEPVTFYWDEAKVQALVDKGLIATREQLDQIICCVVEAWSEASFDLISESYGMSMTEEESTLYTAPDGSRAIMLALDYCSPGSGSLYLNGMSSSWVAAVSSTSSLGFIRDDVYYAPEVKEALLINTYYYKGGIGDINGFPGNNSISMQLLDRVICHELVHGTMSANVNGFGYLPSFLKEGLAELVHGVDDVRYSEILDIAYTNWTTIYMSDGHTEYQIDQLKKIFDLSANYNNVGTHTYGGGYALLRYLAKTASDYTKTFSWSDFDCDRYIEEVRSIEASFGAGYVGTNLEMNETNDIYAVPFEEEWLRVEGNC